MKKLLLVLAIPAILGCGDGEVECFPGTVWSDRAQGCVRYIPEEQTMTGVTVTDNVPFAHETIQDIIDRGELPPMGDRIAPDHRIQKD